MEKEGSSMDFILHLLGVTGINLFVFIMGIFIILPLAAILLPLNLEIVIAAIVLPFFGIGITQWLYIVPWIRSLKTPADTEKRKGIIAGGVITLLINGMCFGPTLITVMTP